jgi:hypothetical protein
MSVRSSNGSNGRQRPPRGVPIVPEGQQAQGGQGKDLQPVHDAGQPRGGGPRGGVRAPRRAGVLGAQPRAFVRQRLDRRAELLRRAEERDVARPGRSGRK